MGGIQILLGLLGAGSPMTIFPGPHEGGIKRMTLGIWG